MRALENMFWRRGKVMEWLNSMCENCLCLGKECAGTCNQVWTGCIYRKISQEETARDKKRSLQSEKRS